MEAIFKAKDAQIGNILNTVEIRIFQESNREGRFISLSSSSIIEVHLSHSWGSNWHNDLSQEISIVVCGKNSGVHSVANKAIIQVTLSLL